MPSKKKLLPKPRLPRGLKDRFESELASTYAMMEAIRRVYERYGFEALETPFIEYTDALGKFLPDQDRPNEGVFSFQDDDEQWLSLRYDLTAPLARHVAEHFDRLPKPFRSYRSGFVFRNEKPGPGRFRQFLQFDADTVGAPSIAADAEMCMMAADTLEALGLKGQYVIKVNNRKLLDGVMEAIGLGGEENAGRRLMVLRALDKFDKVGVAGVCDLLGAGRWENPEAKSGDFTKGVELAKEQIEELRDFFSFTDNTTKIWEKLKNNPSYQIGQDEIYEFFHHVHYLGYDIDRITFDASLVRGLEYYTGPVFEAELTFEVKDEKGRPMQFGSVGGGGRYDGLVGRFRPEAPFPATGFSIGVSRLAAALSHLKKAKAPPVYGPVVVVVIEPYQLTHYMRLAQRLRNAGIRAESYLGNPNNLGKQFKYADKRNTPCVIIQGEDERACGKVQIKDLIEGAKAAQTIATSAEWRETRPAQFSCPESELVEKVKEVLARHGIGDEEEL